MIVGEVRHHPCMKYVFGPVSSRRLGRSLGIDTIPLKTCNWNCVYCQLGRTRPLSVRRAPHCPLEDVVDEVRRVLSRPECGEIDWITFVGSGEPLLHSQMGRLLSEIKVLSEVPVAVLTNGSLFHLPEVRAELRGADAVLPSVDAGSASLYRRINRPHPSLHYSDFVAGLADFRSQFEGKLWVEVMLVAGLNDSGEQLADLARVLDRIGPDAIHVNTPVRSPAEAWVHPPLEDRVAEAVSVLGRVAEAVPPPPSTGPTSSCDAPSLSDIAPSADADGGAEPPDSGLMDAITAVVGRHPMDELDLSVVFPDRSPAVVQAAVKELIARGKVQEVLRYGRRFLGPVGGRYAAGAGHHNTG